MKKIDLTGHRYGILTVMYKKEKTKNGQFKWHCKCDCGRESDVIGYNLRNGHTISCGCKCGRVDIIGKKINKLLVLEKIAGGKHICKCDCGNIVEVCTSNINNGNTQSCGCYQKEQASKASYINRIGNRFGKLTVMERMPNNRYNHVLYSCKCDCGGEIVTESIRLMNGIVNSCGCIKSKGEMLIQKFLQKNKINYQAQYSHDNIFLSSGRRPFFDFAIFNKYGDLICLIEYQGKQHFEFTNYGWNNKDNFLKTLKRDEEKRAECKKLNIKLYEISYLEIDNIDNAILNILKSENIEPDIEEIQETSDAE